MKSLIALSIAMLMLVFEPGAPGQSKTKPPITIELAADTPTVQAGTPITVRVVLTNNSRQSFDGNGCYCGPAGMDSLFVWTVRYDDRVPSKRTYPHPELATGKIILDRVIKPGGVISESQEISRLYEMTSPGKYTIQAAVQLPGSMGGRTTKSNMITITVIPATVPASSTPKPGS